jgi:hypothetical protein
MAVDQAKQVVGKNQLFEGDHFQTVLVRGGRLEHDHDSNTKPPTRGGFVSSLPRRKARFFYADEPRKACHQRLRCPVTGARDCSSRGGILLISQPGSTEDFIALDPHELPRWPGS